MADEEKDVNCHCSEYACLASHDMNSFEECLCSSVQLEKVY